MCVCVCARVRACVRACVRVCVCERERERERQTDRQTDRQTEGGMGAKYPARSEGSNENCDQIWHVIDGVAESTSGIFRKVAAACLGVIGGSSG